jgi:hypothetical protein
LRGCRAAGTTVTEYTKKDYGRHDA